MLTKIISLIMSFIMPVTGFLYTSASNVVDSVSEMLFGIAWYWWVAIILFVLWIIKTA